VLQPALGLGVEVDQASDVLALEVRAVVLLEGGALEALADGVAVGRPGRDAVVAYDVVDEGGRRSGRTRTDPAWRRWSRWLQVGQVTAERQDCILE
jgi:hypothetical protein